VKLLPGAAIALGLDYRISRDWAVGVSARQHAFLDLSTYPSYTQAFARVQYTWGW
jgi:outer membrane protein W